MIRSIVPLLSLALCACSFSAEQRSNVTTAIGYQNSVLSDRIFREVLEELDRNGAIEWTDRLDDTAEAQAARFSTRLEWLLAQFTREGGLAQSQISAWRKWNPFSSTTASTTPHNITRLNLWRLTSDPISLANTLTHERVHFFGVIHPQSQSRSANKCDPAYIAGDLAESILATRSGVEQREVTDDVCPALCTAIARRGLWSPCTGSRAPA